MEDKLQHISNQLDLLHGTLAVTNHYLGFISGCITLLACIGMFWLGQAVVR